MRIKGYLHEIKNPIKETNQFGQTSLRQEFIVENENHFFLKVVFSVIGYNLNELNNYIDYSIVVDFEINAREVKDEYFNILYPYRIEILDINKNSLKVFDIGGRYFEL